MGDKNILEIKEQALEKIKSLQKLEPDFVLSWLGGLTDLEQKIISSLYQINSAVTIKEIMDKLIKNTLYANTSRISSYDFPFKSYFILDTKLLLEIKTLHPALPITLAKLKEKFKFPSFRRIDKSIQDLINMGVILVREGKLKNEKIKGLYFLNPIIRSQLNKLNNKNN